MTLQQLATHLREERDYRVKENMSPTMTVLIAVEDAEKVASALESVSENRLTMMMKESERNEH